MHSKYLYRKDDGERFTKQSDGKYTMDNSEMYMKYRYTYASLKSHGFVESLEECDTSSRNENNQ